jgi:nucleoside-diphosphate-sugar epimerase
MERISILGCGWLGLPLATTLLENGYSVRGSTTTLEKIPLLENAGISSFQIELTENIINGSIDLFLAKSNFLIIDIPPKLRGNQSENFVRKIQNIILFIEKSPIEKVIFVSSTSVFPDSIISEKNQNLITEDTKPQPDSESGIQLLEAEKLLFNNSNFKTTVIRFGGLIGENRHPIHFLAGKKDLENPEGPINLIHLHDCIGLILAVLDQNFWNKIIHGVAPHHPTRKEYYTEAAKVLNLPIPTFAEKNLNFGKIISSIHLNNELKYEFINPNLNL